MLGELARRLGVLFRRRQADCDLDAEIRLHLELLEQQHRERGVESGRALALARRRFGNPERVKEDSRDAAGWRWLDDFLIDQRDAIRSLTRHRAYTVTVLVTLALGIGATTSIFSVVSSVVLRPLPFPDPDRLVRIAGTPAERGEAIALADLDAFRQQSTSFEAIAGYAVTARYLRTRDGTERVMAVLAERSLLRALGVAPLIGRTLQRDDPANVAVVSHRFWCERLGANPAIIGTTLDLEEEPVAVVGVMPASFQFPNSGASALGSATPESSTDVWLPMYPLGQPLRGRANAVIGRLSRGTSVPAAAAELSALAARRDALLVDPELRGRGLRIEPLADAVISRAVRRPLWFLLAAVSVVLALVCANITNLSLVRMTLRSRDVAVRAVIGARPGRLVRQFLTESLLLSLVGGALGLLLARFSTERVLGLAAGHLPRAGEVTFDWPIYAFMLAVCIITVAACGAAPALTARHADPQVVLRESGAATASVRSLRLRDTLVVAEIALAFLLAAGGALLVRELARLRNVESGLVSANAITLHLGHRMTPRTDPNQFYEIADRGSQFPGVSAAGFTQMLQNWGWFSVSDDFRAAGRPAPAPAFNIELRYVTPGYFDAIGISFVRGRAFTARDTRGTPRVIVINQTLARRYFGDGDPIGPETTRGAIVGVVRDVRQVHLDRPANPEIYLPVAQNWSQVAELGMTLVVRTQQRPEPLIAAVSSTVVRSTRRWRSSTSSRSKWSSPNRFPHTCICG